MEPDHDVVPSPPRGSTGRTGLLWRLLVPFAFALAGILLVTSAVNSRGTDLREGRVGDLDSLVRQQKAEADVLDEELARLTAEVESLSEQTDDTVVEQALARADRLRGPAGLRPVVGPGLTVTLDDAPPDVAEESIARGEFEADDLVVHQQDIQAVVNALWAGGAEAMTIQGQRVISTTAIKCVGNTVVLHGIPYSPPYVVTAVGDPAALQAGVDADEHLRIYRQYADAVELGWEVEDHDEVQLPGFEGLLELDHAHALGGVAEAEGQ